jgi:hypothetical protein
MSNSSLPKSVVLVIVHLRTVVFLTLRQGIHGQRFHQQAIIKSLVSKYFMSVIGSHVFKFPANWRTEDTKLKIYRKHAAIVLNYQQS